MNDEVEAVDHDVELLNGVLQKQRVDPDPAVGGREAIAQSRQQVGQRVVRARERLGEVLGHFLIVDL